MSNNDRNHLAIKVLAELRKKTKKIEFNLKSAENPLDYLIAYNLKLEFNDIINKVLDIVSSEILEKEVKRKKPVLRLLKAK